LDDDIDPVGACVGPEATRIRSIVTALEGEKIDIVPWDDDPARYVCAALAPAAIERIMIDEENGVMELIIPDEQMEVARGQDGTNLRLAAKLTGWQLDLFSKSRMEAIEAEAMASLARIPGLDDQQRRNLFLHGIHGLDDFVATDDEFLASVPGFDADVVQRAKRSA
jgi:N utilization substance protein A